MLIYEFPSSSLRSRANPNLFRRSFEPYDHMLYHRVVMEPHRDYPIQDGTRYILLTKIETVRSKGLQATASYPGSCTCKDKQKAFGTTARPSSKKNRVFITPVIRPPVLIARPSTALSTPQPVSIPERSVLTTPPELTTSQIPDPPELTTHLRSFYQIHLSRRHLKSFYQIHHLWSRLWNRPLWTPIQWIKS
ncbi:hypothetical protein TNCV_620621 [Trichonephila clavipes]|nr:hypothetical protein TNCV_620621 [Trichonephila clavipes]